MNINIENVKKFFSKDKFAEIAGIKIESIVEDSVECSMEIKDIHRNAAVNVHGGAIFTLADFTFGIHANVDNFSGPIVGATVTQSCTMTYLKSTKGNILIAKSKCIKKGRNMSVFQIDITDDLGEKIAVMIGNGFTIAIK